MSRQWRWTMKSALSRTLSHPPPPRTAPNEDPAYQHLCHVNEDEPWRAHYQERYHTSPIPPETAPTNTQRINTYVTSMKMNHEERTIKNVITPPHAPEPPQPTPSVSTPMSRQWRWTMKSALSRTLSHPPHPPWNRPSQHPAYQHLCHVNEDEPWRAHYQERYHTPPPPWNRPNQHPAYQHLCHVNEDEPWRAHYQERYHTPTPRTPPQPTPSVSTPMSRQWRWTTEDLVEHLHVKRTKWTTSSCKTTSMYETHVQSIKMCKLSGAPSPRVTKNMSNDFNVSVSGFYVTCAAHVQRMCSACAAHVQRFILDWLWLQAPLYSYTH